MSVNLKIKDFAIKKPIDVSKELEINNFRVLRDITKQSYLENDIKSWIDNEREFGKDGEVGSTKDKSNIKGGEGTQFRCFQKAMKALLAFGQYIGINPVTLISGEDVSKIRFEMFSWSFLYTIIIAIIHTIILGCAFYVLLQSPISIRSLTFAAFYTTVCSITYTFIWISTKWNILVKETFNCNLDEYIDEEIVKRVKRFCTVVLFLAVMEQVLSLMSKIVHIIDCQNEREPSEALTKFMFPWLFDLGAVYSVPLGIMMQVVNTLAVLKWNYCDLFIVCMSLYLTSILNKINKKILWATSNTYLPSSIWEKLREDYTRAARLVRLFDKVFSGLILVSFASNLFFLCLQLFNCLTNGIHLKRDLDKCTHSPSGPFRGYEYPVHLVYTFVYLFMRFLTVSLVAASVNVASLVPAPALYKLPSCAYTKEVQRFIDQLHGDMVSLSGMEFFQITRHIILSAAGTLITYELVLLQFNSEDLNKI